MAEAALSATETALENQRIGPLQIRVAAICTLVQMCDGYDVNSIGVSVPSLTHAWNLPGPAFTTAFLWSSIGIMVGALSAGPIGDRFGRKPLLIASLLIFGLASFGSAFAGSLGFMTIMRFFTGLGIPLPALNAAFVSRLELYGGILLVVGLATRLVAAGLASTMVVALMTADKESFLGALKGTSDSGLTDVAPFVYLLFLAWLVLSGPGAASLDRLIFGRFLGEERAEPGVPAARAA